MFTEKERLTDVHVLDEERPQVTHTAMYDPAPPFVRGSLHLEIARGLCQFGESIAVGGVGERVGRLRACPNLTGDYTALRGRCHAGRHKSQ